ncbi:hypothetical protein KP509_35G066900 [Ceratopteris richardii]|uniref:50S ribosomal protein L35 n=1 Tax=Ceratopteris richardii TaxID=49495 RepID=A0A8T2QHZ5_CERRI|nr:hypothetical protein KP509_35G066900 [Ceratopteris richardii]
MMRKQLCRLLSTMHLPIPRQQGAALVARQTHFFAPSQRLWTQAFQPIVNRDVQWPTLSAFHQWQQQRTFASKVKKYKLKSYTAFKGRFKLKANGEFKRWRAGKRHNAHSKTNKQIRQLRRPAVVHSAYAKVMKKLNFSGS